MRLVVEPAAAEEELRNSLSEKEVLLRELQHRVKNNLQSILALIGMQNSRSTAQDQKQKLLDLEGRVRAMALVHESLMEAGAFENIRMQNYLKNLLSRIIQAYSATSNVQILIDAQDISLKIDTAIACGLIVNELATNSMKYAFTTARDETRDLNSEIPVVELQMTRNDKQYTMFFKDNGRGFPKGFDLATSQSLGLQLVSLLVKNQLGGEMNIASDKGVQFDVYFPVEET